ncbi:MAG: AsmA-like C-terminal domain-containing protein [Deltaproteobacteria bacterium]
MKKRILIKVLSITAMVLVVFLAAGWAFLSYQVSRLDAFKQDITTALSQALDREVTYEQGKAALTLRDGLAIRLTRLVIREKDRSSDLLTVRTAFFRVDLLPLLINRVTLGQVFLDQPRVLLRRDQAGALNIADLLSRQKKPELLKLRKVTIEDGSLTFTDETAVAPGLTTLLTNVQCRIDAATFGDASRFQMTATLRENKSEGTIALAGTFQPASSGKPMEEGRWDASVRLAGMDIDHYRPYLHALAPRLQAAGRLSTESTISGTLALFTLKGTVAVKDARFQYAQVFRKVLQPGALRMDYTLTRGGGHLNLAVARLVVDRVAVAGRFAIRDLDKDDPMLEAVAATSVFSLAEMKFYIPWEIIPPGIGRFIESHITGGDFRLVEGRLNGRLSQITRIMEPENAGVLSIRAEVKKGVFAVGAGDGTPDFREISGALELKNRAFALRQMTGRFGASPCRLEGGISDFALPSPAVYTARLSMEPAESEVIWLLGKEKFRKLKFAGPSLLLLTASGPAENFRISADWDLTGAAYAYPDIVEKPKAKTNRLKAEITLTENAFQISSLTCDLPPLAFRASAAYRFVGKKSFSLAIRSNKMDLSHAVSVLPGLRPYDPAGSCEIDLAGRGESPEPGALLWKGSVSFADVAFQPPGAVKRISGLTGTAAFQGGKMETTPLTAQIGESVIHGQCRIRDLGKVKVACRFDAPRLQAADLGLSGPDGPVTFHNVRGRVTFEDDRLHIGRLSLQSGKSFFNFAGDVLDFAGPRIVGDLNSAYIHSDDAFRLMALKTFKQEEPSAAGAELDLNLRVDAGSFENIDFKKLKTGLTYARGSLNIEALEAGVLDGSLKGGGRVAFHPDGQNVYTVKCSIDRASLEKFKGILAIEDRSLTGKLSLTGDLAWTGSKMDDLRKTAGGTLKVKAEKGVLKKFSVLSKIFSLLNVSQLLKFQLPDMAKDGMPYKTITADLLIKEGVLSSKNFLIDSDAMKISAQGKVDILKKQIDGIVGVHPLQTLDRIAARIPIAGWVLTDEGGNLITVHFQVEGSWEDPDVRPIPARSLARGTVDTFRRLFQLPEKLITDTGEVILGR